MSSVKRARRKPYRASDPTAWLDNEFRKLTRAAPNGQTLYWYLLTGPRSSAVPGVAVAQFGVMAVDLQWSVRALVDKLTELHEAGMADFDQEAGIAVLTCAFMRAERPREAVTPGSPNSVKTWCEALLSLPESEVSRRLVESARRCIDQLGDNLPNVFAETMGIAKSDQRPSEATPKTHRVATVTVTRSVTETDRDEPDGSPPGGGDRKPAQKAPDGYRDTIAAFDAAYQRQTGSKPTWGGKQCAIVKRLLVAHGADVVQARIERLFGGAIASWCTPPYDVGTLAQHFDKLAPIAVAPVVPLRPTPSGPQEPERRRL